MFIYSQDYHVSLFVYLTLFACVPHLFSSLALARVCAWFTIAALVDHATGRRARGAAGGRKGNGTHKNLHYPTRRANGSCAHGRFCCVGRSCVILSSTLPSWHLIKSKMGRIFSNSKSPATRSTNTALFDGARRGGANNWQDGDLRPPSHRADRSRAISNHFIT